jgi:hypothetical protein
VREGHHEGHLRDAPCAVRAGSALRRRFAAGSSDESKKAHRADRIAVSRPARDKPQIEMNPPGQNADKIDRGADAEGAQLRAFEHRNRAGDFPELLLIEQGSEEGIKGIGIFERNGDDPFVVAVGRFDGFNSGAAEVADQREEGFDLLPSERSGDDEDGFAPRSDLEVEGRPAFANSSRLGSAAECGSSQRSSVVEPSRNVPRDRWARLSDNQY